MIVLPEDRIDFTVQLPTSTNALHRSTKAERRFTSKEYAAWQDAAGKQIMAQRAKLHLKRLHPLWPFGFCIAVHKDDAADVDNRGKAALDLLVRMGIVGDDKLARVTICGASPTAARHLCRLSVWRMGDSEMWVP